MNVGDKLKYAHIYFKYSTKSIADKKIIIFITLQIFHEKTYVGQEAKYLFHV